jgi:tetratricopeptide (TPR) repeat protein
MLVFPRGERVELVFEEGRPVILGRVLSVIGWALLLGAILAGTWLARAAQRVAEVRPIAGIVELVRRSGSWTLRRRRAVLLAGLAAAALLGAGLALKARGSDADSTYRMGQSIYDDDQRPERERLREALPYFRAAQELAPLSATATHSTYYESVILFRLEEWSEAEQAFQGLLDRFPEADAAAESQYHVGLCRERQGDVAGAIAAWETTRERYPDTPWATYAGERLEEVGRTSR